MNAIGREAASKSGYAADRRPTPLKTVLLAPYSAAARFMDAMRSVKRSPCTATWA